MKLFNIWVISAVLGIGAVLGFLKWIDHNHEQLQINVQKVREKYGCTPTNEFVGRGGERLWLCANGLKYKEDSFYSWARDEKD